MSTISPSVRHYILVTDGVSLILCTEITQNALNLDYIKLTASDGVKYYSKLVSAKDLAKMAQEAELSVTSFGGEFVTALSDSSNKQFTLHADRTDSCTLGISCKKESQGIKFLLGTVELNEITCTKPGMAYEFMSELVTNANEMKRDMKVMKCETARFKVDKDRAIQIAEEAVTAKSGFEADLLSRVGRILNEKKIKIKELQNIIDDLKNSCSSKESETEKYDSGEDTDTEKERLKNFGDKLAQASTSKDEETAEKLFVPKRKRRGKGNKVKDNVEEKSPAAREFDSEKTAVVAKRTRSSQRSSGNSDSLLDKLT